MTDHDRRWNKRKVLVTGTAGFIGSHLVDTLLAAGHQVIGIDVRSPVDSPVAAVNLAGALAAPGFTGVVGDLATDDLTVLAEGCDTVFHLAAIPGVRPSWGERFTAYVTANIVATRRVIEACERAGVRRLVYASSSSVYGSADRPSREGDPTCPMSPYGVTKLAGEQLCLAHAQRHDTGLSVAAVRYFTVYGPRQRADMAIGRVLVAALDGVPIELYGDGRQRREFTYVSDVVAATIAAGTVDAAPPVINVGGGASVTMTEVLRIAAELTGSPVPVVMAEHRPGDVAVTEADLALAKATLGYRPAVGLVEGMSRQLDWLVALGPEQRRVLMYPDRSDVLDTVAS